MNSKSVAVCASLLLVMGCSKKNSDAEVMSCGSSQADAIGIAPDGSATVSGKPNGNEAKEKLAMVGTSGDTADVVRQLSWQLCNARIHSWIDDDYFRRELTSLRLGAFARPGQPNPSEIVETPASKAEACLTAAGDDLAKRAACPTG